MKIMSNEEDPELMRLRHERLQKILQQKNQIEAQKHQKIPTVDNKIDMLLNVLLAPDAIDYLEGIKQRDQTTYQKVRQNLFPPSVIHELDTLMAYFQRGMIRRGVISQTEVRYLERQALGIGSSITIKKHGEDAKSLGNYLKEEN
jgi:hypothetical protein